MTIFLRATAPFIHPPPLCRAPPPPGLETVLDLVCIDRVEWADMTTKESELSNSKASYIEIVDDDEEDEIDEEQLEEYSDMVENLGDFLVCPVGQIVVAAYGLECIDMIR